uniref:ATP synthase 8 n=1 Tax=Proasellus racovitzai TaxID=1282023 RepID=A0A485MB47_9CRUS|nr:ATP synthase 8 [Proasellus racovitzai]
MAPMFWTLLLMVFTLALLSFMVKLYFYPPSFPPQKGSDTLAGLNNQWSW